VVVWGRLHGTVHAGAFGDNEAVVCALDLSPTQLRIGRYITRSPDERRRKSQPETARVTHGRIEAVVWNLKSSER
jgi:septum site-determining protein MinC